PRAARRDPCGKEMTRVARLSIPLQESLVLRGMLLALVLAAPISAAAQATTDRHVVIVTPDRSDGRLAAAREAIVFWNQTLADLGVPVRLVESRLLVAPSITRSLEGYTRQIWLLAGRSVPKEGWPIPPRELMELEGDIVMFFSKQVIFS